MSVEEYAKRADKRAELYRYLQAWIKLDEKQAYKICEIVRKMQGD